MTQAGALIASFIQTPINAPFKWWLFWLWKFVFKRILSDSKAAGPYVHKQKQPHGPLEDAPIKLRHMEAIGCEIGNRDGKIIVMSAARPQIAPRHRIR